MTKREQLSALRNVANDIRAQLSAHDYIAVKIAMGVATREDYAKEIALTEELRKKLRDTEAKIKEIELNPEEEEEHHETDLD